jgi:hypothetical protein
MVVSMVAMGCATVRTPESYVAGFLENAADRGFHVERSAVVFRMVPEINSSSIDGNAYSAAACDRSKMPHVILVSQSFWGDAFWSEASHRAVIYHELGHCLLGLGHDRSVRGERPVSLMFPEMFGGEVYARNEADYLDRLFEAAASHRRTSALMEALDISP